MAADVPVSVPAAVPVPDGLVLAPFRALRYAPTAVADLAAVLSPPYDVIDAAEQAALEARHARNVVRLILPRDVEDPAGEGPRDGARIGPAAPASRYAAAARTLEAWRAEGTLRVDPLPALYVYEESTDEHVQRGLVGAVALAAPERGVVLPHENTMAGPVADRLALTEATAANLEPIFLVYDGGGATSAAVADADRAPALVETTTPDGVTHRVWALADWELLAAVATDLLPRRAVIADGHHRYATYLRHQADRHAAGAGRGPWDFGLAFLVDAQAFGPQVHAIHRVIPGLPLDQAVSGAGTGARVRRLDGSLTAALDALTDAGQGGPAFLLAHGEERYLVDGLDEHKVTAAMPAERSEAWRRLDVSIAHHYLIRTLWGLDDTEETVDYRHDIGGALAAAGETGGTALLVNPTPVEGVVAVAAMNDRMPRKSTLFTPKPATGLLIRAFADQFGN